MLIQSSKIQVLEASVAEYVSDKLTVGDSDNKE